MVDRRKRQSARSIEIVDVHAREIILVDLQVSEVLSRKCALIVTTPARVVGCLELRCQAGTVPND